MSGVKPERPATIAAGRGRGWASWAVGTSLAAAVLMFCYLRVAGGTQVNSDGAGLLLEASDMLHGNVLLHGWWATDVSFYTTDLPQYLVVTAAAEVRPEVVHICSALTYTMLVLLAAFVARGRARGAEGLVRALLAAGLILAPQPTGPTIVLLGSPDHVGTGVPVLVLLLLLDWAEGRRERRRWYVPVAAAVLLAWSIIGDPLIEVIGVLPLFLACVLRGGRIAWSRRVAEPGAGQAAAASAGPGTAVRRGWSAAWYEWSLALAAVAALLVAAAGNRLIKALGGYNMANPFYHLQSLYEIRHGLPVAAESVLVLFGADFKSVTGTGNVAFALVHLIGVAAVLAGFCFGGWGLVRPFARSRRHISGSGAAAAATPGDLVADFLVIAIAANCAAFALEVPLQNAYSAHEIAPVMSLGAALAGRTLGSRVYGRRAAADPAPGAAAAAAAAPGDTVPAARPARPGARRGLVAALAAGLACYAVMLGIAAAHRQSAPRNVGLTAWLTRHHLTSGFAAYWEASSVTVDSGGAITLLSVTDGAGHGRLAPQKWLTDTLLTKKMPPATFVIVSPGEKLRRSSAVATFGQPAQSYRYGPFTILVWQQNLVPQLLRADKRPATRTVSVIRPDGT
jgi:hypothetical protein